jgi:hypothetical protein
VHEQYYCTVIVHIGGGIRHDINFDYLNFVIFDETNCTAEWRLFESTVRSAAISEIDLSTDDAASSWAAHSEVIRQLSVGEMPDI